ncbi:Salicylic acid-binding protein 2-like protein [Drosera capensis]
MTILKIIYICYCGTCDKFQEIVPDGAWLDTRFSTYGSLENPGSRARKDVKETIIKVCPQLIKGREVHGQGYGSVKKLCLIGKEDKGLPLEFHHWMIQNKGGTTELLEIEGADHMPMLSNPQALFASLLEIANKYS